MKPLVKYPAGHSARCVLVALLASGTVAPGTANSLFVKDAWGPNGPVRAVAQSGNTIYVGGNFSMVGRVSGPAVAIDAATAAVQEPFPDVLGKVRAVEPDGVGGWYLGGQFTAVRGVPRQNLAHIDATGMVTPWNPTVDGEVDDIAVGNGVVYVAGPFSSVGATPRTYVAAIDPSTGVPTAFQCTPDAPVTEIEIGGSAVYLGGTFTAINGVTRRSIAAVHPVTGSPTTLLEPGSIVTNTHGMEFSDGRLFFGVSSAVGYYVRVFDEAAGGFLPYTVGTNGPVEDLVYDPSTGSVWICGLFTNIGVQPRAHVGSFVLATGAVTGIVMDANGPAHTLARLYGEGGEGTTDAILVGGIFSAIGFQFQWHVAAIDPSTATILDWNPGVGGEVYALEAWDSTVYAGGDFPIVNAVARANLAALDATSGAPLSWNPFTDGEVEALLVSGSTVYIGGQFSHVNAVSRSRAASVDAISGMTTGFNPNVDPVGPTTVRAFARLGSTLYMAGAFGTVTGSPRVGVASVDATTGTVTGWNANVNGSVYAMSITFPSGFTAPVVVIGGQFTQAGGQARSNLASLNGDTGVANTWNPGANGPVLSLILQQTSQGGINRVYAGGGFSLVGGQSRNGIASIDGAGTVAALAPNPNNTVYSMTLSGNTLLVGGAFTSIGGQTRHHIAGVDLTTGLATAWDPGTGGGAPDGLVYVVRKVSGIVYAGGTFTRVAATPHSFLAGISDQAITAVEPDRSPVAASTLLRAAPNPFHEATSVRFSLVASSTADVAVYDVAGRRVRGLHEGWLASGPHRMAWDGRDDAGHPLASGVYFLGVRTEAGMLRSKVYRQ